MSDKPSQDDELAGSEQPFVQHLMELRDRLLDQHIAINDALQARDGPRARAVLEDHLDLVARTLTAQRRADDHAAVARLRLQNRRAP